MFVRVLSAATVAVVMPLAASAAHVSCVGSLCGFEDGATPIDVLAGPYDFNATFIADDPDDNPGQFTFSLFNSSSSQAAITVTFATIRQSGDNAGFTDGVTTTLGSADRFTPEGVVDAFTLTTTIAAGGTSNLIFDYGDAYGTQTANGFVGPDIDFTLGASLDAAVIPVPAAGILLVGALAGLGGLGAMRRKSA